jgi:hypothetical protein
MTLTEGTDPPGERVTDYYTEDLVRRMVALHAGELKWLNWGLRFALDRPNFDLVYEFLGKGAVATDEQVMHAENNGYEEALVKLLIRSKLNDPGVL